MVAPQNEDGAAVQELSKTGTMDDTVLIDNPPWLASLVAAQFGHLVPKDRLFPFEADQAAKDFKEAASLPKLPGTLCTYQLRHGGASEVILSEHRSSDEVKARGCWCTETSLRRYAKPAQVQRLLNALQPHYRAYAEMSFNNLEGLLKQKVRASLPSAP